MLKTFVSFLGLLWAGCSLACAEISLPPIFSDHLVLQRSKDTALWGTAAPNERVSVILGTVRAQAVADGSGHWKTSLDLSGSPDGPFEMVVAGGNKVVVQDVLVGDVWFCSGQSNMEFNLDRIIDAPREINASANPQLRMFTVGWSAAFQPAEQYKGRWEVAGPTTSAKFSAVGYFFGKELQGTLHRPVGLIHSSAGGSPVEAWISPDGFAVDPKLAADAARMQSQSLDFPARQRTYAQAMKEWAKRFSIDLGPPPDASAFAGPEVNTAQWKTERLPNTKAETPYRPGEVRWYRRTVPIPAGMTGQELTLLINNLHQFETVYWNGVALGGHTPDNYQGSGDSEDHDNRRSYKIPAGAVKAGDNVLTLRLYALAGTPSVGAGYFFVQSKNDQRVYLGGNWAVQVERPGGLPPEAVAALPPAPEGPPIKQAVPGSLFNGMVAPLVPYGLTGFLWYQGEANIGHADEYATIFPAMIVDWRRHWHNDALPFYFCQLPSHLPKPTSPGKESPLAELRAAQAQGLKLPKTGMAVTVDVGEANDNHPREKKTVGERLAAIALAQVYGKGVPFRGPAYESMTVQGALVRLRFRPAEGGLTARPVPAEAVVKSLPRETVPLVRNSPGSELEGFEVRGGDGRWQWADARIDGGDVIVQSPQVARPVAVRYDWADNPSGNLYDRAGFPAAPFRTDGQSDAARTGPGR